MRPKLIFCLSFGLVSAASGAIVPGIELADLVGEAQVIAVGPISSVRPSGNTTIDLASGVAVPGRAFIATMIVDQVLKGDAKGSTIDIGFALPDDPIGYLGVLEGQSYVVFLREAGNGFEFVSAYFPAILAVSGARGRGSDPFSRVLSLLSDGLNGSDRRDVKSAFLHAIFMVDHPSAVEGLNVLTNDADPDIRFSAIANLLRVNQTSALPLAEDALRSDSRNDSAHLENIRIGIGLGIRSEAAIPTLERLLQFPEPETRRAAVAALSNVESSATIVPLLMALEDSDYEVRLNAAYGLAKRSGNFNLTPTDAGFRSDEQRFILPLRSWANSALAGGSPER